MASLAKGSPPRKRRSSERGRERDHEPRKKRKESSSATRERTKSSKKKSSKESKDSKPSGLKVRTVTELAALVASGAVRVPQSLQHYVGDRTQLLDQVFTILSPGDVTGMLPDVLKGLKMRQIKQLCLNKLQSMREEDVLSVIEADDLTLESNLNNTLLQLLGPPPTSESQSVKRDGVGRDSVTQKCDNEVRSVKCDSDGREDKVKGKEKTIEIAVSDISDISDDEMKGDSYKKNTHSKRSCGNSSKGDSPVQRHPLPVTEEGGPQEKVGGGGEGSDSSDSEQEDLSSVNQLLEMELRQRALESALKRASGSQHMENNVTGDTTTPMSSSAYSPPTKEVTNSVTSTGSHNKEGAVEASGGTLVVGSGGTPVAEPGGTPVVGSGDLSPSEVGEMLEQRMRERLLQSLANKKN